MPVILAECLTPAAIRGRKPSSIRCSHNGLRPRISRYFVSITGQAFRRSDGLTVFNSGVAMPRAYRVRKTMPSTAKNMPIARVNVICSPRKTTARIAVSTGYVPLAGTTREASPRRKPL